MTLDIMNTNNGHTARSDKSAAIKRCVIAPATYSCNASQIAIGTAKITTFRPTSKYRMPSSIEIATPQAKPRTSQRVGCVSRTRRTLLPDGPGAPAGIQRSRFAGRAGMSLRDAAGALRELIRSFAAAGRSAPACLASTCAPKHPPHPILSTPHSLLELLNNSRRTPRIRSQTRSSVGFRELFRGPFSLPSSLCPLLPSLHSVSRWLAC